MNIYLITIGTFGLMGLIKLRKKDNDIRMSYIDSWEKIHKTAKKDIFIDIIYKLLYVFSLCQIKYNKISKYLKTILNLNQTDNKNLLILNKNGEIIRETIISNPLHLNENDKEYSGLVFLDNKNVIFYEKCPDIFDYKVLPFHFINVELEYNNRMYTMLLKTDSVNYYIVNNSLNTLFVKYYIQNVLHLAINKNDTFQYKIYIIDHNVNCFTIDQNQELQLTDTDTGYNLVNC
jgi:hypothetical protein